MRNFLIRKSRRTPRVEIYSFVGDVFVARFCAKGVGGGEMAPIHSVRFVLFVALFTDRVSPILAESRLYPVKIWFSGADTPAPGV